MPIIICMSKLLVLFLDNPYLKPTENKYIPPVFNIKFALIAFHTFF